MNDYDSADSRRAYNRLGYLKNERSSWMAHWKEISDKILPRSGRFFVQGDTNKGNRKHNKIYDSTGTEASRILAAGMMSGNTSPARPWVRLGVEDSDLNDYAPVKVWCSEVTKLMLKVFQKSNTYRSLHTMYEEQGVFGTAASIILPDYRDVIRHYTPTIGEYCIATDYRGEVNTIYREFQMTAIQVVREFGLDKCSNAVKNMYNSKNYDGWVTIIHAIEPREDRDPKMKDSKNMAYKSCYFEQGANSNQYLRESGFNEFPCTVPRWATSGGDIYGNSPGMEALGGINQLQHETLRKAEAIDYKTKPPLLLPTNMLGRDVDLLPGGVTFCDTANPNNQARTAYDVNLDLSHLLMDIQDVRGIIRSSFFSDLFLMLSNNDNPNMTATEVAERHEEKMLMLGPVIERQQNELLKPLIDQTFQHMLRAGIVPPPPPELQGQELQVEYVSVLAQAQKAIGTTSIDRFVNGLGMVAQFKPDVLDKLDSDRWADVYSDSLGVDPSLIVASDKVALIRKARADQQAQAQQSAMINQGADTAQKLSNSNTSGDNALSDVMRSLSGYN